MSERISWMCPHCDTHAMVAQEDSLLIEGKIPRVKVPGRNAPVYLQALAIVCPNPDCNEHTIRVHTLKGIALGNDSWASNDSIEEWAVRPAARVKVVPSYVPPAIQADYREACLIRDLSPKASATLSRRCLQGMIRDFHQVKPANLFNEINEIKDKVDAVTWAGIDAVRKVGNIGAHMEKDVDVIVDVEPAEAQLLIGLIETLIKEWYVARHDRQQAMDALIKMSADKDAAKRP
jgi:hypothetical protein